MWQLILEAGENRPAWALQPVYQHCTHINPRGVWHLIELSGCKGGLISKGPVVGPELVF